MIGSKQFALPTPAALIGLCLTLSLVSCANPTALRPDPQLTRDCDYPVLQSTHPTYRDIVLLAEKRGEALTDCTARLRAIRRSFGDH